MLLLQKIKLVFQRIRFGDAGENVHDFRELNYHFCTFFDISRPNLTIQILLIPLNFQKFPLIVPKLKLIPRHSRISNEMTIFSSSSFSSKLKADQHEISILSTAFSIFSNYSLYVCTYVRFHLSINYICLIMKYFESYSLISICTHISNNKISFYIVPMITRKLQLHPLLLFIEFFISSYCMKCIRCGWDICKRGWKVLQ